MASIRVEHLQSNVAAIRWNAAMTALAAVHGMALLVMPSAPLLALGLWWNSNTIAHNFIHRPFFRRRWANVLFAGYESVLLGIPHAMWRDRHLAHHAAVRPRVRPTAELTAQTLLVLSCWSAIAALAPRFFLSVYVPGYLGGLILCAVHGHYEHAGGAISHYGALYNLLCFNDGYHAEHHAHPGIHWHGLPQLQEPAARRSAWPAPLRWMDVFSLQALERLVLHSRMLQRAVLRTHRRALYALLQQRPAINQVAIVGGGLFPRTALILRDLLPAARLTIIDASAPNLDRSRTIVGGPNVEFVHDVYRGARSDAYDLVVIPLSFEGDRAGLYAQPPAPLVLVHDWIWRKRGVSRIVSLVLLKRINLLITT